MTNHLISVAKSLSLKKHLGSQNRIKRILIPIDFSESCRRSLKYAVPMAEQWKASIFLVHVVPTLVGGRFLPGTQISTTAMEQLRIFASRELPQQVRGKIMVIQGSPHLEIAKLSRKLKIDMPITQETYNIIYRGKKITAALESLMSRALKSE